MNPAMPIFNPMMPHGSGLTPQPVQNTNRLLTLEEQQRQQQQRQQQQRQQQQRQQQQANTGLPGTWWQTPQRFHSQTVVGSTTAALPRNTPLYNMPPTQMTPATPASEGSGTVLQLQNIVSSVNLGCKLDLRTVGLRGNNVEYNPKRFSAVVMRIRKPRTTALIFSSGKIVCTGAKSVEESKLAARRFARMVQKLDFPARFLNFRIQNMVGSCDVKFPIRLEGISLLHQQCSSYEPELFPGLTYRMIKPKIILLIFASGKVVFTGAKKLAEIYKAFENIYPILKAFHKTT